jgi:hypothetical protein
MNDGDATRGDTAGVRQRGWGHLPGGLGLSRRLRPLRSGYGHLVVIHLLIAPRIWFSGARLVVHSGLSTQDLGSSDAP